MDENKLEKKEKRASYPKNIAKMKVRKEKLIACLIDKKGIVTNACKQANITRKTFYQYCVDDPEFKAAVLDIQEVVIDFVENKLYDNIKRGDIASAIFYMKTKGKGRGYSERIEIDQKVGHYKIDFNDIEIIDSPTEDIDGEDVS